MDSDFYLVIGCVIGAFSIPRAVAVLAESRVPVAALVTLLIGAGLVSFASLTHPGGYTLQEVPHAFTRVIARMLN